jgi:hypothetical protein
MPYYRGVGDNLGTLLQCLLTHTHWWIQITGPHHTLKGFCAYFAVHNHHVGWVRKQPVSRLLAERVEDMQRRRLQ